MEKFQEYVLGAIGMLIFLGFCSRFLARKEPKCKRAFTHQFGEWRISGQDVAQVRTCIHCGYSTKIPLD
jgi:hypothetical protein